MIRSIQYLRGLAALMVVWVHAAYVIPEVAAKIGAPYFGGSGVDLFFVISGFIMVVTTSRNDFTPLQFFTLRVIRVVPLYWVATLAVVACGAWAPFHQSFRYVSPPTAIAKSLLFIPFTWYEKSGGVWPILASGWTLNYEMFFYALFALSLGLPRRFRLAALGVTLGSLVVMGRVLGPLHGPVVTFYTRPWLLEFAAGMTLAYGWMRHDRRWALPLSILTIVLGLACLGSEHSRLIILSGAFLVVAGSLHPRIVALQNRPLLAIGDASYSIYLSHLFVLEALGAAWTRVLPAVTLTSSVLFVAAGLGLCAVAGWLCYRFIEKPLTSQLRKLVQGSNLATAKPPTSTSTATASSTVRYQ